MSAFTVRPEEDVTPGEAAAIVLSKALDPRGVGHQCGGYYFEMRVENQSRSWSEGGTVEGFSH